MRSLIFVAALHVLFVQCVKAQVAEPSAPSVTIEQFMEKSDAEQGRIVLSVLTQIMNYLVSPLHHGQPKPPEAHQSHMAMARFLDELFFDEDEQGNVTANEKATFDLFLFLRAAAYEAPTEAVHTVIGWFLQSEYEKLGPRR